LSYDRSPDLFDKLRCLRLNTSIIQGQTSRSGKVPLEACAEGRIQMIQFTCGGCGHTYRVPDKYAGKKVRCKECELVNRIPIPEASAVIVDEEVLPVTEVPEDYRHEPATAPLPKALIRLIAVVSVLMIVSILSAVIYVKRMRAESTRTQFIKHVDEIKVQVIEKYGYDFVQLRKLITEESDEYERRVLGRVLEDIQLEAERLASDQKEAQLAEEIRRLWSE